MFHATLTTTSDLIGPQRFEHARHHGMNYILRKGRPEIHVSDGGFTDDRGRPEFNKPEHAIVIGENVLYSFYVEPLSARIGLRRLHVGITSPDEGVVRREVEDIGSHYKFETRLFAPNGEKLVL